MIEYYAQIKWVHVAAVLASGSLFFVRGSLVLAGSRVGMAAPVRFLSYAIDTDLLTAALMLATMLHLSPIAEPWLATKVFLLVDYIALGTFALKRGKTERVRAICFVAALLVYGFIYSVARTHDPFGWLQAVLDG